MAFKEIAAADVLRLFKGQAIQVQTATPTKRKGEDGIERPAYDVKNESLKEEHVLSAKQYEDGRVTITTIDGQRYEAKASKAAAA